ncbi:MAG TPA: NrfD/PsrC family molybdoenzyme membrane anchor subunit, partial [Acidimicrobiales bacterium]|nr:NrfD/PsrC family molybdoenzyme membrane anchor subunit [Acidimicrobiales bacterium]
CPVGAMYRRRDGIVDFDSTRCIGCKACMQACPYDAVHIDPERRTAAKCHFCAHRIEMGMEPACVAACPEQAIVAGDLDDPASRVARLLATEPARVSRPEKKTAPKLFYIAAEDAAIIPGRARDVGTYLFATADPQAGRSLAAGPAPATVTDVEGGSAVVAYDVGHVRPWSWQVPAYFWTKSIGAGALFVPALAHVVGGLSIAQRLWTTLGLIGAGFMALTTVLLVSDLSRPARFVSVLLHLQLRSWVARGALCLLAYGAFCTAFLLSSWGGAGPLASSLLWPAVVTGLSAAAYTAFLFGQCKGRDLWLSPLLPIHLLVQCGLASSAILTLVPRGLGATPALRHVAALGLAAGLAAHSLAVLREFAWPGGTTSTPSARRARWLITRGPLGAAFWGGAITLGVLLPAVLLTFDPSAPVAVALAGAFALLGLLSYGWCFVMAGQAVANS